ncbi:hypothetical protein O7635_11835 [Asanoa sp. WMMD1127]|uniref:hypothetical protein n=1 Tax=Asanoa sp. WMMD1127 TaxID=3016107 RepID=UPI0024170DF1|nr:hypothetical protein [Asanoa sp. WMMD1127]MDG4822541.1 hypothetical protein [Asanoa sp. WMMD1127]
MTASRRRLWVIGGLTAWALVLAGLGVLSHRDDPPTVKEQRDLSAALRVVSEATGFTVGQAGTETAPVIMPTTVDEGCRLTPFRSGATATGVVRFFTADAAALMGRLAAGYPAAYEARLSPDGKALRADAGEFVALRGKVITAGEVQVTVTTGCRPVDGVVGDLLPEYPQHAAPAKVFAALGASSVDTATVTFAHCPSGRAVATASAVGHGVTARPAAAREHDQGVAVVDTPEVYAYRRGAAEAVAVVPGSGGEARVYVTELC